MHYYTRAIVFLLSVSLSLLAGCGGSSSDGDDINVNNTPPKLPVQSEQYTLFESGQVRPLVIDVNKNRLYALNTPDNRLEIFEIEGATLRPVQSLFVGLEPVALAISNSQQLWVVNHLSDSISVVDVSSNEAVIVNTLHVGDEPRDIVFAGPSNKFAFITTAHRGQRSPVNFSPAEPGVSRADVWVFDSENLGTVIGGEVYKIISMFGDTPRPLAKSPDGSKVYAGIFHSGNQTTSLLATSNIQRAAPNQSNDGITEPDVGLIVKFKDGIWQDERGLDFSNSVMFSLPDYDVFEIDASTNEFTISNRYSGVGTTLYNMAVSPKDNKLFITNTDANNHIRFVGDNNNHTSVNGHFVTNRITLVEPDKVTPITLNPHLNTEQAQGTSEQRSLSVSQPMAMQFIKAGNELLVTSFGTAKVVRLVTDRFVKGDYVPDGTNQILLSSGGPSGIVVDNQEKYAYVLTRFDNGISTIDLSSNQEVAHVKMFSMEPSNITEGRKFLYDATLTSGQGNVSCASCHVFGDLDQLAWDLGDPDKNVESIQLPYQNGQATGANKTFHPLKGPMTTQSMRGIANHGPMHWRGDRTGKDRRNGESLERAAFKEFNEAFTVLMGRDSPLSNSQMESFANFALALRYPPNPIRNLDNRLTAQQKNGEAHYKSSNGCGTCHTLDPSRGIFGTTGLLGKPTPGSDQDAKIPHFRNLYQKVGMFGTRATHSTPTGDQIRGFGYLHNGSLDIAGLFTVLPQVDGLLEFLMAYPSEQAPAVGQQITVNLDNKSNALEAVSLIQTIASSRGDGTMCDLIVHGKIDSQAKAWLMQNDDRFKPDKTDETNISLADLFELIKDASDSLTFTCTPLGNGYHNSIDRDNDTILNRG